MSLRPRSRPGRSAGAVGGACVLSLAAAVAGTVGIVPSASGDPARPTTLTLVTLDGPGTSALGRTAGREVAALRMLEGQEDLLDQVAAPEPVYRWTTALNGFAVELDAEQAAALAADPRVALVEANEVRPLADAAVRTPVGSTAPVDAPRRRGLGAGVVIGFVDSGVDPDSRAFSRVAPLGPAPADFAGSCAEAPEDAGWDAGACGSKVVAAQHYVAGFGEHRLGASAVLSPADTDGHGTAVASVAAGADDVPVEVGDHRLGRFSGVAPRARVAAYKACWTAPDPADDGCATADLVSAIDRATADGVDVLNLSVGGPSTIDTVERALLGATESGVVVVAAAGNGGSRQYAAHPSPWVVTVGATTGPERVGAVRTVGDDGPTLRGAMSATTPVGPAPLVLAEEAVAPGASLAQARVCARGSLDARVVAGAVVVCERGRVPRLQKSRTVALSDGVGMVLVNDRPGSTDADLHEVPTVHLPQAAARRLLAWERRTRDPEVRLAARGTDDRPHRVARFSSGGDPAAPVLKPDLVAEGVAVPAGVPGGWDLVTGSSVAAARVSGQAAVLLGRRGATADLVRSDLLTTARPLAGATGLRAGAGRTTLRQASGLAVVAPVQHYRAWLTGDRPAVNQPHLLLSNGVLEGRRTLRNTGRRPVTVTATVAGLEWPATVTPAVATIRPGRSATFRIRAGGLARGTEDGAVLWRTGAGRTVRVPVVVTR